MNDSWKNDPRIKNMNPEKLDYLTKLVSQIEHTPKSQLLSAFMNISLEAKRSGIQFTNEETSLLASIITDNMSPEEKKRAESFKRFM